ncbi:MAG: prolipoprotein diacylglyceryl transferase [Salinivirgaceae bacterium]|jgi:phosphatidylglycerol:prolipoprotein diacylglycerol transferase|nr:prolipoprotein diacylglyceryl transferase [Salinivirgaceae bacterium]
MTALYIHWNVNPEIFTIGDWGPRWYGVLFALGFVIGYYIMLKFFKKEGIKQEVLDSLTMHIFLGTLIGARLGHCLFYEPSYYLSNPVKILMVWQGGLASHGAAVGILIALFLFIKKQKKPFIWIMDNVMIVIPFALFCIRLGNLMNSEIYGHVTNLPWGIIFERNGETEPKHPTQLYEGLSYLLISVLMYYLAEYKNAKEQKGLIFGLSFILLFSARFLIEFVKENQVDFEKTMTLNMGQLLSVPFILLGFVILVLSFNKKLGKG